MVLWQSPDTPFMSCFYVRARLRVCSSRALSCLRALFCVGAWCSDPGTHILSFGFVSGFGHSRSMFCLIVWAPGSSSLGRALSSVHVCFVLHAVHVFIGCMHSCYVLCCVARSLCFSLLRAFMLSCLVWTRGLWVFSLAACRVLFCTWLVICFAGHVLVFLFCGEPHGFCLSFLCAMCSHVNCLDPIHLVTTWLLVNLPHLCLPRYPPHCSLYNLLVFAVPCQFVFNVTIECILFLPCLVKPCQLSCFPPTG